MELKYVFKLLNIRSGSKVTISHRTFRCLAGWVDSEQGIWTGTNIKMSNGSFYNLDVKIVSFTIQREGVVVVVEEE